jgi:hypothetical protein
MRRLHPKHQRLLAAIRVSGWRVVETAPGCYLATDPASDIEHSTPEDIPKGWWPWPTYRTLRQLSFAVSEHGDRFVYVAARESAAPWVQARERRLSLAAAIAYLQGGSTR